MVKLSDIPGLIQRLLKFITEDVWRVSETEISAHRNRGYKFLKVISLAVRRFIEDNLQNRASALTYSTLLSLVPMLAVLLSIAKGFGFNNIIESQLFDYFPGQRDILDKVLSFVDSYMAQTKNGLFVGLGIILLLYTVFNLINSIEDSFNSIWQVKKGRTYARKITDYFSIILLLPIFIVFSSGLSIFISTTVDTFTQYHLIAPVYEFFLKLTPYITTVLLFTLLYIFMPNTKVQFKNAFYAGLFSGIAFQFFQYLYISGQIWVSKYNAIYGSFALLPLLLLWMQLSWTICLLGAEIAYASQNVKSYEFEADSKSISRRYHDFLLLLITTLIVKRFAQADPTYTADEISVNYKIPIRLTKEILFELMELNIINEIKDEDQYPNYQPALDISKITIGYLFSKVDTAGSENFIIDKEIEFKPEWDAILQSRENIYNGNGSTLLKDL